MIKIGDGIAALERIMEEHGDEVEVLARFRNDRGAGRFAWIAELEFRFGEHWLNMLRDGDEDDFCEDWQGVDRACYCARTVIVSGKDCGGESGRPDPRGNHPARLRLLGLPLSPVPPICTKAFPSRQTHTIRLPTLTSIAIHQPTETRRLGPTVLGRLGRDGDPPRVAQRANAPEAPGSSRGGDRYSYDRLRVVAWPRHSQGGRHFCQGVMNVLCTYGEGT